MKKAFTLIELIFVIVIVGILARTLMPNRKTNSLEEAGIQLLSDIRYTQHLAMIDDKFKENDAKWYKGRWQIVFGKNKNSDNKYEYTIFSDTPKYGGDASIAEIAKNIFEPYDKEKKVGQVMSGGYTGTKKLDIKNKNFNGMSKLNIGLTYGITKIKLSGGCKNSRVVFDYLGRPLYGDSSSMINPYRGLTERLIKENCNITLSYGTNNLIIAIRPETGYISITQWK